MYKFHQTPTYYTYKNFNYTKKISRKRVTCKSEFLKLNHPFLVVLEELHLYCFRWIHTCCKKSDLYSTIFCFWSRNFHSFFAFQEKIVYYVQLRETPCKLFRCLGLPCRYRYNCIFGIRYKLFEASYTPISFVKLM